MDDTQKTEYRNRLLDAEQKIGESCDKTLITLSGGALAISVTFIKEVLGEEDAQFLCVLSFSWSLWAISLTSVLLALYFASHAYRNAIKALDAGTLDLNRPGGVFSLLTNILNAIGGLSFLLGVLFFLIFAYKNI